MATASTIQPQAAPSSFDQSQDTTSSPITKSQNDSSSSITQSQDAIPYPLIQTLDVASSAITNSQDPHSSATPSDPPSTSLCGAFASTLNALEITKVSDEELVRLFFAGPVIYSVDGPRTVVRLSETLVIKGGLCVSQGEAETQRYAHELGLPVPAVHHVFSSTVMYEGYSEHIWFIVMDFVPGQSLEAIWPDLGEETRKTVVQTVAGLITKMQSMSFDEMGPGPVGNSDDKPWDGPYFTGYGAGPFETTEEMEDWFNHKIDVCEKYRQAPPDLQRFDFDRIVLTHQDISPRNLIFNEISQRLWLVDWGMSGIYPTGFEQAALSGQGPGEWDEVFCAAVLAELPEKGEKEISQLNGIMYALTTGFLL